MRIDIKKLLVPVDGSDLAERAVEWGKGIAMTNGAELILVRVVDYGKKIGGEISPSNFEVILRELKRDASVYLEARERQLREGGLQARTLLKLGPAVEGILEAARETEADLIVMSSHGYTGLKRWFLGSVAEGVLRAASVPTLMVPVKEEN